MLKGQDILIALMLLHEESTWNQSHVASQLKISTSEVGLALKRLEAAKIYRKPDKEINRTNLLELLTHALKYFFPVEFGAPTRGIPTAWGYKKVFGVIRGVETPVWPHKDGDVYGPSIPPIYKTAPIAIKNIPDLYPILAAIDALRIGSSREAKIAIQFLKSAL